MLSLALLSACFAGCALAGDALKLPSSFPSSVEKIIKQQYNVKRINQVPLNPPVCPVNVGPFWQIAGSYPYEMAADLCAAYGWRLAMLTEENASQMSQVAGNCSSFSWIAGAYGLPADPCAFGFPFNGVMLAFQNLVSDECINIGAAPMCEEIPQVTLSQTTTIFNMTIAFGQTTTTATELSTRTVRRYKPDCSDCQKPPKCSSSSDCSSSSSYVSSSSDCSSDWSSDSSSSSSSSSDCGCPQRGGRGRHHKMLKSGLGAGKMQAKQNSAAPVCYGENCLAVCNVTLGGIHLITGLVNYTDASAECAKYGWSLLDFTTAQTGNLTHLTSACPDNTDSIGYINSFNGVQSPCQYVLSYFTESYSPVARVGMPTRSSWCAGLTFPVYCQERCPFDVSDSGLEIGQVSLTTDLASTTATLFTPTTTVVVSESCTETVFVQQP